MISKEKINRLLNVINQESDIDYCVSIRLLTELSINYKVSMQITLEKGMVIVEWKLFEEALV